MLGRRPEETAAAFGEAAREAGAGYAFIGALAVGAWGQPRASSDVDCLLDVPEGREAALAEALRARHLAANPRDFVQARSDRTHVTVFDEEGPFHIDCKLALTRDEREEVRDAVELSIPQGAVRVARAEDTVAHKVAFGSPQDLRDAQSIVVRQGLRLDDARLLRLATRLGVLGEVQDLLRKRVP